MITSIKNKDYTFLFREATNDLLKLHDDGIITLTEINLLRNAATGEVTPFTSLEQFFTRLGTLLSYADRGGYNKYKYLVLPLDEPCLEVNANTRMIDLPANFKKYGVSVQGDVVSEILKFRIDRFFDSMDFLETDAMVQWKLKDGTEGVSTIPYIDYQIEHFDGKLILLWPLTDAITAQDGNVEFSLRFVKRAGDKIVYSWNSVPATFAIKKALNPQLNYSTVDSADDLFLAAIENSSHVSDGDNVAPPTFISSSGFGNPVYFSHDSNKLTLKGHAVVEDQGALTYRWEFIGEGGSPVATSITNNNADITYFEAIGNAAYDARETYYIKGEDNTYDQISNNDFDHYKNENREIFIKSAQYIINKDESPVEGNNKVVGTYKLTAIHKLGFGEGTAVLEAVVPGPKVLEFAEGGDLNASGNFIGDDKKLTVNIIKDPDVANAKREVAFTWQKKTAANGSWEMVDGGNHTYTHATQDSLNINNVEPGWYKVSITSMLNRATTDPLESTVARVTNLPEKPTLEFPYESEPDGVKLNAQKKAILTIKHQSFGNPALESDSLRYKWFLDGIEIASNDTRFEFSAGRETLTVLGDKFQGDTMLPIRCHVYNSLNGKESEAAESGLFIVELF